MNLLIRWHMAMVMFHISWLSFWMVNFRRMDYCREHDRKFLLFCNDCLGQPGAVLTIETLQRAMRAANGDPDAYGIRVESESAPLAAIDEAERIIRGG